MDHGLSLAWKTTIKMVDGFFAILPNLLIAAVVFALFYMLSRASGNLALLIARRAKMDKTLARALEKLFAVCTNLFGLLVCAVIVVPSFSLDKLIAGLGITSVAIGFAFQNILQNFFAGMLLLWQKPFGIGDEIKTRNYEGTVEDITIRTTILKTFEGQRVYIPNGVLFTDPVTVNTAYANRKLHLLIPVSNQINEEKAIEIAQNALNNVPSIAKQPTPEIYVTASGDSTNLDIYAWSGSRNSEIVKATDEATFAVQSALSKQL